MSLKDDLENARPGETVTFTGRQSVGKVIGIRGTMALPISLEGADPSAVLVPEVGYTAAVARFEDCQYFQIGRLKVDGEGRADRAIQLFTSDDCSIYDVETRGVTEDHLHVAGCNRVHVLRVKALGEGGEPMGGGKAGHCLYFTRVDGGRACETLHAEDCDSEDIAGAAYQANGDGAWLYDVRFTRCRGTNYGWVGGSGINLAQCVAPWLQDIILVPHRVNDNPGIAVYDGTQNARMDRFSIECDDLWSGELEATSGQPATPENPRGIYGSVPGTEPPDETEPPPSEGEGPETISCPTCGGSGLDGRLTCVTCSGTGVVKAPAD